MHGHVFDVLEGKPTDLLTQDQYRNTQSRPRILEHLKECATYQIRATHFCFVKIQAPRNINRLSGHANVGSQHTNTCHSGATCSLRLDLPLIWFGSGSRRSCCACSNTADVTAAQQSSSKRQWLHLHGFFTHRT